MGNLIKTPYSEVTATLEILASLGVTSEHLARLRTIPNRARQVADALTSIEITGESELLSYAGTIKVPATGRFFVSDHFTADNNTVKIAWIGDNFKKWFSSKVEEPQTGASLCVDKLNKDSLDVPILSELRTGVETTLANIWEVLKTQPGGESGMLLTNGSANIFYVRDAKGALRAVFVAFFGGYWLCEASSIAQLPGWRGGRQVFSRSK